MACNYTRVVTPVDEAGPLLATPLMRTSVELEVRGEQHDRRPPDLEVPRPGPQAGTVPEPFEGVALRGIDDDQI